VRFTVKSNRAYGPLSGHGASDDHDRGADTGTTWTVAVHGGTQHELHWKLDSTGHWYDFVVTADSDLELRAPRGRPRRDGPSLGQRSGDGAARALLTAAVRPAA
jgi:hypothetical protein